MAVLADEADEVDQVLGIVLEREIAVFELYVARVDPVGDEHLMVAQQRADRAAQQGGEMAGHRRDEQDLGIVLAALAAKAQKLAERRPQDALLLDRNDLAARLDAVDAVVGPRVGEAGERDEFVIGRHAPPGRGERVRRPGLQDGMGAVGGHADPVVDVGHPLVGVIHH